MLAAQLREKAEIVKAGEQARKDRALLIQEAGRRNWPREYIAGLAGVTHQAVTQQIDKIRKKTGTTE